MIYISLILTASIEYSIFCMSYSAPNMQVVEYHGIRPTDPGGRDGLVNPERGWRIEALIGEPDGAKIWGPASHLRGKVTPGYNENWWILDTVQYEPFGLTLAQTYCYLDGFMDKPISQEKLDLLQRSLDNLRKRGLKAVLRFAYEKDMNQKDGPELQTILSHIDQLGPIIERNVDVIFVLQAGFVGAWGEWHNSAHGIEKDHSALAAIVDKVLEVLPSDRMTQVRVPKYKRWVLGEKYQVIDAETTHTGIPASRIGFHNDGFLAGNTCGGTWTEPPFYSNPGNPEFDYMTAEGPYVLIDGELFWADQGGKIDGLKAAIRMRLHHYSSFSLAHSYSEREGKPFSIDEWMITTITEKEVIEAKLPLSDGYFRDIYGNEMPRTQFEYIQDHLGYRIEMQMAKFSKTVSKNDDLIVETELINRGFSAIHNPRPVCFVLIDPDGCVTEFPVKNANPQKWQPYNPENEDFKPLVHKFSIKSKLPDDIKPGWYQLGLWMPDASKILRKDSRYAIKVANRDIPWWIDDKGNYGVNILGVIQLF